MESTDQQLNQKDQTIQSSQTLQEKTEPPSTNVASVWDKYAVTYQNHAQLSTDVISYGPRVATENELRLLGPLSGKRILDLGCGGGQSAIAMAKQGAVAIGVDISFEQLAYARRLVEQAKVRVELRHGDLAELAFQRADTVDVVFSAFALQYAPDIMRVFRQVHRVLKPLGTFVFSIPHPIRTLLGYPSVVTSDGIKINLTEENQSFNLDLSRPYDSTEPIASQHGDMSLYEYPRSTSELFAGLVRSGYRVDNIIEPVDQSSITPKALIIRSRKEA